MLTLKLRLLPLAVFLALPLTACETIDLPPPDESRSARVAMPVAPAGEAMCDDAGDGTLTPCLSDRQIGLLLDQVIDALCAANDQLAWFNDYHHGTNLGPSCAPGDD